MTARDDLLATLHEWTESMPSTRAESSLVRNCWTWAGGRTKAGYGVVRLGPKCELVHRVAYQWAFGPIPEGKVLDHLCRNRACVNPEHLEPVESGENTRRGVGPAASNAAKTHCPQGHEYTPENTYVARHSDGSFAGRKCRTCERARCARRWASKGSAS